MENLTYIAHYGVMGQKKGVRRWQYKDMSLTPEGRIHYGVGEPRKKKNSIGSVKWIKTDNFADVEWDSAGNQPTCVMKTPKEKYNKSGPLTPLKEKTLTNKILSNRENKLISIYANKNSTIDPETGLRLKNKKTTIEEDLMETNPLRYLVSNSSGAKSNCGSCAIAFDLRRRGFDVVAMASKSGVALGSDIISCFDLKNDPINVFRGKSRNSYNGFVSGKDFCKDVNNLIKTDKNDFPDGSSGLCSMLWEWGGGHVCNYKIDNGKCTLYDAQCGEKYPIEDYLSYVDNCMFTRTDDANPKIERLKGLVI